MSEIEMKIKEHTQDIAKICDMLTRSLQSHLDEGIDKADTQEAGAVVDMIKDLSIAKEKAIKGLYYAEILEAMQGKDYGEDYDEEGPKFYRGRSARTGRFVHRAYTEPLEEMRMYTEAGSRRNYEGGRSYEEAKGYEEGRMRGYNDGHMRGFEEGQARGYEESKEKSGGKYDKSRMAYQQAGNNKEKRMESLNEYLHTIADDLTKMITEMDTNEKQTVRNKLQAIQNKIS